MLMNAEKSALVLIDLQARLAPAIHQGEAVIDRVVWLAGLAGRMDVPTVITEHWPEKIGETLPQVRAANPAAQVVRKACFSAQAEGVLDATAVAARRQVVICGTETHVCVLQTALELRWAGKEVFVVAEACGSRDPENRRLAFERMRAHGLEIVSAEMVAFEWLQRGGTEQFREINRDFIR